MAIQSAAQQGGMAFQPNGQGNMAAQMEHAIRQGLGMNGAPQPLSIREMEQHVRAQMADSEPLSLAM